MAERVRWHCTSFWSGWLGEARRHQPAQRDVRCSSGRNQTSRRGRCNGMRWQNRYSRQSRLSLCNVPRSIPWPNGANKAYRQITNSLSDFRASAKSQSLRRIKAIRFDSSEGQPRDLLWCAQSKPSSGSKVLAWTCTPPSESPQRRLSKPAEQRRRGLIHATRMRPSGLGAQVEIDEPALSERGLGDGFEGGVGLAQGRCGFPVRLCPTSF